MAEVLKMPRNLYPSSALAYAAVLPKLQAVARAHGYALTVHGSMATDFDLVAVPWIAEASEAAILIEAIRASINGYIRDESEWDHNPAKRPHGRLAWSIYPDEVAGNQGRGPYLDISVMPRGAE
jgi:hypothetical protein